jgi:hypothetical protein
VRVRNHVPHFRQGRAAFYLLGVCLDARGHELHRGSIGAETERHSLLILPEQIGNGAVRVDNPQRLHGRRCRIGVDAVESLQRIEHKVLEATIVIEDYERHLFEYAAYLGDGRGLVIQLYSSSCINCLAATGSVDALYGMRRGDDLSKDH